MYRLGCISVVVVLFVLGLSARAQETSRIQEITASIAQGANGEARRAAITRVLADAKINYELQEAGEPGRSLTNVIATVPGQTSKTILLGAHYDRVAQGNGVLDNGASCAVLLTMLQNLRARPASLTVRVVFFDLEELGLLGSKAYFAKTANEPPPAYAVNLDVFGYGDSFFIATANPTGSLATKLQQSASEAGLRVRPIPPDQYPGSDHISMIAAGIETVGISLLDAAEVEAVLGLVRGGPPPAAPPRVFTIIHTARDTMDVLRLADVTKGSDTVERFVRALN
jgi:Zn-dependent M28 family amino/carboxypeptidase